MNKACTVEYVLQLIQYFHKPLQVRPCCRAFNQAYLCTLIKKYPNCIIKYNMQFLFQSSHQLQGYHTNLLTPRISRAHNENYGLIKLQQPNHLCNDSRTQYNEGPKYSFSPTEELDRAHYTEVPALIFLLISVITSMICFRVARREGNGELALLTTKQQQHVQ